MMTNSGKLFLLYSYGKGYRNIKEFKKERRNLLANLFVSQSALAIRN